MDFQKLCQVETRTLLLFMGIIASFIIIVQFASLPYENILFSLFPVGKVPLLEKGNIEHGDSSKKPALIGRISTSNSSNSSNLSAVYGVLTSPMDPKIAEETKHDTETKGGNGTGGSTSEKEKGLNNSVEQDEDPELDDEYSIEKMDLIKNSSFENVTVTYSGSVLEKAMSPEKSSPTEQAKDSQINSSLNNIEKEDTGLGMDKVGSRAIGNASLPPTFPLVSEAGSPLKQVKDLVNNFSSNNFQKEDIVWTLDRDGFRNGGPVSFPPASPPMVSSDNLNFPPGVLNGNLSSTVVSVNSSISSAGKQAGDLLPKDEKSDLLTSSPTTLIKNLTPVSNPLKESGSVTSLSEMRLLLRQNRASNSMISQWPSVRDKELLYAKSQIENAPIMKKNRELYGPLFHNVSMFRRSYELMEKILKVYIYREGAKPIFHQPELRGIYASEGWFMKHMETNKQFVVKNPREAHLFYLPFSTRQLEHSLYVPNSHSHKNMVAYLNNYVDLIAAKYPFWNRTEGADHFLVACHDWAPAETRPRMSHCVRALCNADVNEGFTIGKDVSLPETNVRTWKDPLKDLGGQPPSQRQTLAFFAGSMHGYLRPVLLQYWENKDPDMKIFGRMGRGKKNKNNYIQYMKSSKYCICAKGYEVNSPRVVEAIFYECIPVIISDNYVPPFFEVLNWEAFAIFVPEKDIPNLKNILLSIPHEKYLKMQMRVRRVQQHFLWHMKPVKYDIFHMILHSIWYNRVFELKPI